MATTAPLLMVLRFVTGDHDPTTAGSPWGAGRAALVLNESCGVNRTTRRRSIETRNRLSGREERCAERVFLRCMLEYLLLNEVEH